MTYTPGPWRRGTGRGGSDCVVCDTEIKQFDTASEDSLRAYGGHLVAESIATNNLNIIAAAPELLEALELARWFVENFPTNALPDDKDFVTPIEKVSAAIAKARRTT